MDDWTASHDRVLARRNAEGWMFLLEAARDLRTTGAIAPSGRALARLLTDPVQEHGTRPLNVLEAGAGTGSVTRTLISRLSPGSRLDIVEANARFASRLRQLVHTHPQLAGGSERARVHHTLVEQLDTHRPYDVIVSGLPFTNFAPDQVETIMDRYMNLLHPGGTLTYFAYRGTRWARALTASRAQARRHRAVEEVLAGYQRRYATGRWTVWGNLPPANVWQLRRPARSSAPATPDIRAGVAS
ncbi:class I SAM-dependent methyltransferase [Streptomyces sp. NPDC001770]